MLEHYWGKALTRTARDLSRARMSTERRNKIMFGPFEVTSQVFLTTPHSFALVNLKPLLPGHVLVCPARPHKRLTDLSAPELTDLFTTVQRVQRMLARHYFSPSPSSSSSSSSSSSIHPAAGAGGPPQRSPSSPSASEAAAAAPPPPPPPPPSSSSTTTPATDAGSFNIALQDGPEAGQTVAHVHVHVIPRVRGRSSKPDDGTDGDALYEGMAGEAGNVGGALWDRARAGAGAGPRPVPGGGFDRIEDAARKARSMGEMEAEAELFRAVLREVEREGEGGGKEAVA